MAANEIPLSYLSKREAAAYLRRCTRTLESLVAAGELPAYRVRGKLLFRRSDLDAYVDTRRVDPRRPNQRSSALREAAQ